MSLHEMSQLKNSLLLISGCAIAFAFGVFAVSLLVKSNNRVSVYSNEGFDFRSSLDENDPSAGPNVGTRINLARLKMRNGLEITRVIRKQLVMLVTVDPGCGACKVAADEMGDVQNRIEPLGIEYYPVSVTASATSSKLPSDFFDYTDSFGLKTPGFLWANDEEQPLEQLFMMVMPSHLLVDCDGVVLRKWPGTDKSPQVRKRMANQIVADTVEELKLRTRGGQF
jgi:hypothetical protein